MTGEQQPIRGWRTEATAPRRVHASWRALGAVIVGAIASYSFLLWLAAESIPPWSWTCTSSGLQAGANCDTGPLYALVGLGCLVGGLVASALVRGPEGIVWIVLGVFLGLAPLAFFFEVRNAATEVSGMASGLLVVVAVIEVPPILLGYGLGRLLARLRSQAR
jgi:hypothetical protein